MWTVALALIAQVVLVAGLVPEGMTRDYANCKLLSFSPRYLLYWNVNATALQLGVHVDTDGWVGFGFSADGSMDGGAALPVGSDLFVGWVGGSIPGCADGCLFDYWTNLHDTPYLDGIQNVFLLSASRVDTFVNLEFDRLLVTGDNQWDRAVVPGALTHVVFSTNENTLPAGVDLFTKHTFSGSARVQFTAALASVCPSRADDLSLSMTLNTSLQTFDALAWQASMASELGIPANRIVVTGIKEQQPAFCPECTKLEFKFPDYQVPRDVTTYACAGFTFPASPAQQIIRFDAVVDNALMLHHIVLFSMATPYQTQPQVCNMPQNAKPLYAWAPGGLPVVVPPEAGFNVGGTDGVRYGVLQMHYNNPTELVGERDSSSIVMYLTTVLRPNPAGLMFLGPQFPHIRIPGRKTYYHYSTLCGPIPLPHPVTVFSTMGHAHKLGRQVWTQHHAANGTLLGYLSYIPHYDYGSQKFEAQHVVLQPNEFLRTHCTFNSYNVSGITYGGESTQEEMCLDIMLYYPDLGASWCGPFVDEPGCACNLTSVPACENRPECTVRGIAYDACYQAHETNCGTCAADVGRNCYWCNSAVFSGCLTGTGTCPQPGTASRSCAAPLMQQCSVPHNADCQGCVADTANKCQYCSSTHICLSTATWGQSATAQLCANSAVQGTLTGTC